MTDLFHRSLSSSAEKLYATMLVKQAAVLRDKTASAVKQLSTAPRDSAPTPPILRVLTKEHAKDHPGMKRSMPTNPGPAYPSVEAEKRSKLTINIPMLGKSASVRAFRRLADEVLPTK